MLVGRVGIVGYWLAALGAALGLCLSGSACVRGTPAGTPITNSATLSYTVGGQPPTQILAVATPVIIAELISVTVTWQDGGPVPVRSPEADRALAFVVSNVGNGTETFRLTRDDSAADD